MNYTFETALQKIDDECFKVKELDIQASAMNIAKQVQMDLDGCRITKVIFNDRENLHKLVEGQTILPTDMPMKHMIIRFPDLFNFTYVLVLYNMDLAIVLGYMRVWKTPERPNIDEIRVHPKYNGELVDAFQERLTRTEIRKLFNEAIHNDSVFELAQ